MNCPCCGKQMRKAAVKGRIPSGKVIVVYVCPNTYGCGTIINQEED